MGFRFRKRIRIAPGIAINISKSGVSTSVGAKGATVNIGKKGVRMTNSLPGTGLSYTTNLSSSGKSKTKNSLTTFQKVIRNILFVIIVFIIIKINS